jgi:CheY-like chemotaxis protein
MMPDVTGGNLAASILELRENTPIILCTGYINEISEERIRQIGIKKNFGKTFE